MRVSRRGVLAGAAVGGGLLVAWGLRPRSFPSPLLPGRGEHIFGSWLKIGEDGVITVAVPQLEMGQGITTILPQIICAELGADWRQIAVEPTVPSGAYANIPLAAKWSALWMPFAAGLADEPDDILAQRFAQLTRFTATADGLSLAAYEEPCREAAASARMMLVEEAAARWKVDAAECDTSGGFVIYGGKRLSFADLAVGASQRDAPDPPLLRAWVSAEKPVLGQQGSGLDEQEIAYPRLDLPSKVDGTYLFAGDVRLPDMLYVAIKHGPVEQSELTKFNAKAAAGNPRVATVIKGKRWLAVAASDWWSASKTLEAMKPRFSVANVVDSTEILDRLTQAAASGEGYVAAQRGVQSGESETGPVKIPQPDIARRYSVAPAVHAPLETASATARYADGKLELWIASQAPERARVAAAEAIGISLKDVVLYPMPAGGSFDRRLEHDHAVEIALIAREVSQEKPRPVQLIWSRWEEHLAGLPRAPAAGLVWAKMAKEGAGRIDALRARVAVPSTAREFGERLFGNKVHWAAREDTAGLFDPMAVEGAMPPYAIPSVQIEHIPVDIGHSTGRMRGNAHGYTAFFIESFIDEAAFLSGREPLSYRIEMLGNDPRLVACLQHAARLGQWNGGRDHSGQGVACHRIGTPDKGGCIACVATARQGEGGVKVSKLSVAVDIGRITNLDIAKQQIEGGLIFGLSLALGASTEYAQGLPTAQNLRDLNLPLLADCPEIEVEFIPSDAEPFDPGDLGVAVSAPAIANALRSATGLRFRRLPLFSEGF